jgi:hypothetical protein
MQSSFPHRSIARLCRLREQEEESQEEEEEEEEEEEDRG